MPTSINEGLRELEEKIKAERAIAEKFPDAYLHELIDGRYMWVSRLAREHVTDVDLIYAAVYRDRDWESRRGQPRIECAAYTYLTIEGMRVYAEPSFGSGSTLVLLADLKKKHPEAYKALVDLAR